MKSYKKQKKALRKFHKTVLITGKTGLIFSQKKRNKAYKKFLKKINKEIKLRRRNWKKFSKDTKKIIKDEWRKIVKKPKAKKQKPKKKKGYGFVILNLFQDLNPMRFRIPPFRWTSKSGMTSFLSSWPKHLTFNVQLPKSLRFKLQIFFSVVLSSSILGSSIFLYFYIFKDLPNVQDLIEHQPIVSTKITDRNGEVLFSIYKDENRTLVPLSEIADSAIQATIAIEDQHFYEHHGFDLSGIFRAFIANSRGEQVQGGSTITQQLVKNTLLTQERTIRRKLRELLVAITVDASFSKDEILELYLNEVPYGGSTYGIEEAAKRYFGKSARDLSLAESAMLAGLPAAPSVYSPFGSHIERAYARQAEVLRRMVEEEFISEEQAAEAKKEVLNFQEDVIDIKAPHFVMFVKELLARKYGEEVITSGGLIVRTTLDYPLHEAVQTIVTEEVDSLARLRVSNGASMVTDPETGEILSMVGSKDYFDFEHDGQVNVTLRPRQPGSSIKPITYATAFSKGKSPSTVINDSPITYHIPGSPPYSPVNYDGKYHGKVTLRTALASSYNIPAVKLLAEIGVNSMIDQAEKMGIDTWKDRSRFGLSLTLGGGEVTMYDMQEAYGTFANRGYTTNLNPILEITRYDGEVLYRNTCALEDIGCTRERTLDERVAAQISNVLSDNIARAPAFGTRSVLFIPNQEVAVKTGTTNNLRDNWTIGYTSDYVVGTWVGNNDNTTMSYVASGITGASPIWNEIMTLLLDPENPHRFETPENMVKVKICVPTGTLPCEACPLTREELFVPGSEPKTACNNWWFNKKPAETDENRDKILEGSSI